MKRGVLAVAIASVMFAAPAFAGGVGGSAQTEANRVVVAKFARLFYDQHRVREAFETYVAPDYIQHSPEIADGRAAAIAALEPMFHRPGFIVHYGPVLVDGDMAAIMVHADRQGARGGAIVDLYRLKGGLIVEHWDVNQIIPAKAANPHPLF